MITASKENMYLNRNVKTKKIILLILCCIDAIICFSSLLILPGTLMDFSAAAFGFFLFLTISFGFLLYLRGKSMVYLNHAEYYSQIFLAMDKPFVDINTLPRFSQYDNLGLLVGKKINFNILKSLEGALKKGYLINCTIEIHEGIPKVALAKKVVKDKCPNCGAPIIGAINNTYICEYCGNKIVNVIEKK